MVDSVSLGINLCAGNIVFLHLLIECLAVNTLYGAVDQTALVQLVQDTEDTTCAVALLYTVFLGKQLNLQRQGTLRLNWSMSSILKSAPAS